MTIQINGVTVNEAFDVWPSAGKILLQNEGSEIYFRRVDWSRSEDRERNNCPLHPLPDGEGQGEGCENPLVSVRPKSMVAGFSRSAGVWREPEDYP